MITGNLYSNRRMPGRVNRVCGLAGKPQPGGPALSKQIKLAVAAGSVVVYSFQLLQRAVAAVAEEIGVIGTMRRTQESGTLLTRTRLRQTQLRLIPA